MRDKHEFYYIAGLLEGEGSFGFYSGPTIQIYMTDYEPIRRLRHYMKADVAIRNRKNYSTSQLCKKTQYIFRVHGSLAIQWMMTIYPLMSPRRKEQIRNVITSWKLGRKQVA